MKLKIDAKNCGNCPCDEVRFCPKKLVLAEAGEVSTAARLYSSLCQRLDSGANTFEIDDTSVKTRLGWFKDGVTIATPLRSEIVESMLIPYPKEVVTGFSVRCAMWDSLPIEKRGSLDVTEIPDV